MRAPSRKPVSADVKHCAIGTHGKRALLSRFIGACPTVICRAGGGGFPARPAWHAWLGLRVGFGGADGVRRVVDDVHPHAELPTAVNIPVLPLALLTLIAFSMPTPSGTFAPPPGQAWSMFKAPQ